MPSPDLTRVRRVLVLRHRAAGDLLLTTPALRALRAGLPEAAIEILVARGTGDLLRGNPDVDRVLELDRRSLLGQASRYVSLSRGGYDLVLDMVSNPRSAFMAALTRAPIRVGYDIPGRSGAYTVRVPREPRGPDGPIVRYAPEGPLDLVRAIGIEPRGLDLTFHVAAEGTLWTEEWLHHSKLGARPIVACLPSGTWPSKTWIPERFAAVMDALHDAADVVWLWGPGEEGLARDCRARMKRPSVLSPAAGWQELAAILQRCALLVSNDSGPKHLAVALRVPTVTIFGPTHPGAWQPPSGPHAAVEATGLDCLHCNHTRCPLPGERHMRCMIGLTVEGVVMACCARLL
ncbi:MAG TPA: glycosyltransferase family 9 protein [Candidatus Saccharimonadales bacterium]|nr:glycosyltransferase family 9 protein [Candidatus Saccharimonadales bacterium]